MNKDTMYVLGVAIFAVALQFAINEQAHSEQTQSQKINNNSVESPNGEYALVYELESRRGMPPLPRLYRLDKTKGAKTDLECIIPAVSTRGAGFSWMFKHAKFSWVGPHRVFLESEDDINGNLALIDLQANKLLFNDQLAFKRRLDDSRWIFIDYRGKNLYSDNDIIGLLDVTRLQARNVDRTAEHTIRQYSDTIQIDGKLITPIGKKDALLWGLMSQGTTDDIYILQLSPELEIISRQKTEVPLAQELIDAYPQFDSRGINILESAIEPLAK